MGCAKSSPPSDPRHLTDLEFIEAIAMPIVIAQRDAGLVSDGGVISARIVNRRSRIAGIIHIQPVTDTGLEVRYLGHSMCARGCAGALPWNAETQTLVERGIEGLYPVALAPMAQPIGTGMSTESLIFRMMVPTASGIARLQKQCLKLNAVSLSLSDGSRVLVTAPDGHWIAGVQIPEPYPRGYRSCTAGH